MPIRLVFLDVDGTLITRDRRITDRTRAALSTARRAGIRLSLATGRTFESARPYADAIDADAPLVLYNGARIQSPQTGEVLEEWRLATAQAETVLSALEGFDVHVSLFEDQGIYIPEWTERARQSALKDGVTFIPVGDLRTRLVAPPIKLMLIGEPEVMDVLGSLLLADSLWKGQVRPAIVRTEPTYLEVWHPEASKGRAALWVAKSLGHRPEEVIAFGDSVNDLELIRAVGLGVAMGNAHPHLKAAAGRITRSNEEDGIAEVLESLSEGL